MAEQAMHLTPVLDAIIKKALEACFQGLEKSAVDRA